jgi:hypothetical protein
MQIYTPMVKLILTKQYVSIVLYVMTLDLRANRIMVKCLLVCSSCALQKYHLKMKISHLLPSLFHQHNSLLWKRFANFLMLFTNFTA